MNTPAQKYIILFKNDIFYIHLKYKLDTFLCNYFFVFAMYFLVRILYHLKLSLSVICTLCPKTMALCLVLWWHGPIAKGKLLHGPYLLHHLIYGGFPWSLSNGLDALWVVRNQWLTSLKMIVNFKCTLYTTSHVYYIV